MPKSSVHKLTQSVRKCKEGDQACLDACYAEFQADGGEIKDPQEGGKVFIDGEGGKVFITHGGKVF